jgi:hypothetical protein
MEDTTALKKEIKLSWKANGLKTSSMALAGALISSVIAILGILKMDSETTLDNITHSAGTFMMALGKWMRSSDMGHTLRKILRKLT